MAKKSNSRRGAGPRGSSGPDSTLRIIGGSMRGRPVLYSGDQRTRPMKQRVREAIFNLLGQAVRDAYVVDLFAGTGALAWEALSRGASGATLIERHFPTARLIQKNAESLGVADCMRVHAGDTFVWSRSDESFQHLPDQPWLVFCSPPYDLYIDRADQMTDLIQCLVGRAPRRSRIVVESDRRFDLQRLPRDLTWDVRTYPPAIVSLGEVRVER